MPVKQVIERQGGVPVRIFTDDVDRKSIEQLAGVAQLPIVVGHIAAMPDVHLGIGATIGSVIPTRKALIPSAVGVDIGCLHGDTLVRMAGKPPQRIKDLVGAEPMSYSVEAAMAECTTIVPSYATALKTRLNAKVLRVVFGGGGSVVCTPDHEFMVSMHEYREARDLAPGTVLVTARPTPNDTVQAVEHVDDREDVYCLQVPKHFNFALAAGPFVHNCGMAAAQLTIGAEQLPDSLRDARMAIEGDVPVGFNMYEEPTAGHHTLKMLDPGLQHILERHPEVGKMMRDQYKRGRVAGSKWTRQLGTLGGGNHFIEVCLDEADRVWVMLHSGSRGVGNALGRYFIGLAKRDMEQHLRQLPNKDLAYLEEGSQHFDDYVYAVEWAQQYALENRRLMMARTLEALQEKLPPFKVAETVVECHHNYVARERHFDQDVFVTRKGAIRAGVGDMGIIPGSMGAKSYIVRGKGAKDSLESAAHGAGRRMSRTEAKRTFDEADLAMQTAGVECRKDKGVVDEIPGAYKPIDEVIANSSDLVDVVHTLKQVICVKGG